MRPERVLLPRVIEVFTDVTLVGRLALTFVGRAGKDLVADPPLPPLEHAHLFQVRRRATLVAILKEVGQRKRHYRSSEARADNERRVPLLWWIHVVSLLTAPANETSNGRSPEG